MYTNSFGLLYVYHMNTKSVSRTRPNVAKAKIYVLEYYRRKACKVNKQNS